MSLKKSKNKKNVNSYATKDWLDKLNKLPSMDYVPKYYQSETDENGMPW